MRRKMLFGIQLRDFDAGYERRTGRAVALEGDWGITSTSRILSQPEFVAKCCPFKYAPGPQYLKSDRMGQKWYANQKRSNSRPWGRFS